MRVWDLPAKALCRQHLLGQHREIHAIWSVIKYGKKGYSKHPEVLRWVGRLDALKIRHDLTVEEMLERKYKHRTPIEASWDDPVQNEQIESTRGQLSKIVAKGCDCHRS